MLLKTNWTEYLHDIRKREIEIIIKQLHGQHFNSALEMGAGDGFQTTLFAPYFNHYISSDLNFKRIRENLKVPGVVYEKCDADNLDGLFKPQQFDVVYSSNMLEHVRDPKHVLSSTRVFLKESGYAIHIIPSRYIKISYIALYYVNLFTMVLDRFIGLFSGKKIFRGANIDSENNINVGDVVSGNPAQKSAGNSLMYRIKKIVIPAPHGNFPNHSKEFVAFGRKSWETIFAETGYTVYAYVKGPAFSGYGFGLNTLRHVLESLGWSSEHIFILKKK